MKNKQAHEPLRLGCWHASASPARSRQAMTAGPNPRTRRRPMKRAVLVGALLFGLASLIALPAYGTHSAANGPIVFQANVDGFPQLYTISPNGTGLTQVTHIAFEGDSPGAEQPNWSPDGTMIIFDSDYQQTPTHAISVFTIKPDGSALSKLPISVGAFDGAPAYSPNGTKISFDQDVGPNKPTVHGIYVAGADGSNPRRVTTGIKTSNAYDTRSNWSPDGKWIAFTRANNAGLDANFKVRVNGTGLKQLTPWSMDANNARWSPDGSKIVFNTYAEPKPGKDANIFTMRPDGTGLVQLTHLTGGGLQAYVGGWSPDGKQIVFHERTADESQPGIDQLFVMNADGSHVRQLTRMAHGTDPSHAAWGTLG